ncbi:MAG: gamma-glutamyl-gamma-aminobutyrate hydrolase family protein, partial [Clostridia bacterium]|nr:gamma-glutamyl-gamma-aminobutyrate hydrolase family protein [Clostridia bacterium]
HPFFSGIKGDKPDVYSDVLEWRLFRLCSRKPMLGICRGAQVLTVFRGGMLRTLAVPTIHQCAARFHPLFWRGHLFSVRSDHHQAIKTPAQSDRVLARFGDVAELAENDKRLLMQFHPEHRDSGVWQALWKEKRHNKQKAPI